MGRGKKPRLLATRIPWINPINERVFTNLLGNIIASFFLL
jgi:hypothetical protein